MCWGRLQETQTRALATIAALRADSARAAKELEALRQQFRAYQALKAGEVAGLEARLRVALAQPPLPGKLPGATTGTGHKQLRCWPLK